ncbi:YihY/virulence factor BrkB family protein [Thalassobacillus pellis]|uniref:YihY/virulence factor BrkB family protein n=1 Tax=Thalassobacillus pellis TaxID=748008 RepID=UPI001961C3A6|nr:YihY/virulence factor BrkB family protein [Thalassobacillus pellis]MBM7553697.1 membrane protein [Thalassobacillus pellis]
MKSVFGFGKELFSKFGVNDISGMAAQLAYFFLLSLFPFMIFLVTLLGYLQIAEDQLLRMVAIYAPAETYTLIRENLSELSTNKNGGLLSIGILGTLWSASNGVNAIMRAFNRAYDVEESRSPVVSRMIAIFLTISMVIVIGVAFLLPVFGKAVGVYMFSLFGLSEGFLQMWNALRWVVSSIIFFIVLMYLYMLAPNKYIKLKDAMPGAIFATLGWQIVSLLFSFYVTSMGNYSATYGSLGGVIVLMIWFYLSGIIIIIGGEINAIMRRRRLGIEL